MKRMRKITALLLATVMVAGSGSIPNNLTSVKAAEAENGSADLSNYLTVYEDFDMEGYDYKTASYFDLEQVIDGKPVKSSPALVDRTGGGKWAKYTNETGLGYGYNHLNKVNASLTDYDGFAAYVKAETAVTFNFLLRGANGLSRTLTNKELDYTLITKDGKKSTGTGNKGIPIVEGFEGWVVVKKEEMTVAEGWTTQAGVKMDAFYNITNYNQIQAFTPELSNLAAGKSVYVDDFAFVKDCNSFISYMAPPSVYDYLNVYEDFEGYGLGSSYNLDWTDNGYGPVSETAIKERNITGNKWIRFDGNNGAGHLYADYTYNPRTDFSGKNSSYDGMAMYVHTENDATLNIILRLVGYEGISRSALNEKLDYTLIAKDGTKTVAQGFEGMPIPAGFEGWVIFKKSEIPVANGWGKLGVFGEIDENHNGDLQYINRMAVEITNSTAPVYVDDISFVTNTEDMINYLAPEQVTAEDYLVVYEDFDSYDLDSSFELGFSVGNSEATTVIKKKKGKDRWLYLSGNSERYRYYEGGKSNISLSIDGVQGFAYYVKAKNDATLNFLMRGKNHGLSNTMTNDTLSYTLISADGKVSKGSNAKGIPVSAGFEGWVVIEKDQLTPAGGYKENVVESTTSQYHDAFDGTTNVSQITGFAPEITGTTGPVYVDNLSFVTSVDAFVNALKVDRPSHFVKYYETFDNYEVGKGTYAMNSTFDGNQTATATIMQKGLTDKWLKLNGNNDTGHIYGLDTTNNTPNRGWPYPGFSGAVSDYEGISLEVKTEFATTLNIRLQTEGAIARTATNPDMTYQLIDTKGKVTSKTTARGIELSAGFEGTVVFEKTQVTPHGNDPDIWTKLTNNDLSWITVVAPEIVTEGAVYLDNFGFVTDVDKYVASFKNQTYTYGTGDMNEDGVIDDYDVMLARTYLVANNTKMMNLDNNNWKGFEVTDKTVKNVSYNDGVAVYVKTNKVTYFNIAFQYKYNEGTVGLVTTGKEGVKEGETDDGSHKSVPITYTLVSSHGTKMEKTTAGLMEIPAYFEGWVVFDTSNLHRNPGYGETTNLTKNIDVVFDSIIPIIQDPTGAVDFNLDSVSFVNGRDAFISALENNKSVGGYLQTIEDFESMPMGSYTLSGFNLWDEYLANAKIVKNGQFARSSYDYNKDDKLSSADIVRLKKMAVDMVSGISLDNELVQNTSVWNTPGLAENKGFQFDAEATSTWASVNASLTKDTDEQYKVTEEQYYDALNSYKVGETKSLLPTKVAGEWGYSLTQLDGQTDGNGKEIVSTFKKETPISDADALVKMEQFISNQYEIDTKSDKWVSMNGYYPWYHYAAEFGASVVSTEIGENQNNYQMHMAFVRGAGRQYHLPWGIDFSMWHEGYMYNPNSYAGWNKTGTIGGTQKTDEKSGHSLSLLERSLVMGYMGGANSVVAEAGGAMSLKNNKGTLSLTDYGKTLQKVYAFTEKVDSGTAYTPVGIVLNHNHGSYAGIQESGYSEDKLSFYTFTYDSGDNMTCNLMEKIWGSDAWLSGSKRGSKKEVGLLVNNSAYGDSFDILLDNASLATLKSYPVLVLSGAFTGEDELTADQIQMYKQYVNDGGTLILNKAYTSIFPAFDESMPYGDGEVIVYGNSDYDLTGIEEILKTQIAKYQPVNVSATGNDIQYMTSMKDNKLYVTLINNAGVTKEGEKAVKVDNTKSSAVTVQYTGTYKVTSVADVYDGNQVTPSGNAATVTVPAGGIAVLEFKLDS